MLQACNQQSAPAGIAENGQGVSRRKYPAPLLREAKPEEPALKGVNDLTGLPMDEAKEGYRPLAVMINNIDIAQPLMDVSNPT